MTDFGDELHRLLAERQLSLREAARRAGCSAGYLSNVAVGRKPVTPSLATRLDRALGTGDVLTALALRPRRGHSRRLGSDQGGRRAGTGQGTGPPAPGRTELVGDALRERAPGIRLSRLLTGSGADWILDLPPGRLLGRV